MGNILDAIINLKNAQSLFVAEGDSGNRIQIVGSGLEGFVKAMFSDSINDPAELRKTKYELALDYGGNANNPPDIILKNGDAIEVKKVDSLTGDIQLNSSPPKAKLRADDTRINKTCRELASKQGWNEKDIIYAIGSLSQDKNLIRLCLVYGDCIAADHEIYEKAAKRVKYALAGSFEETELGETNELGSVPKIDPLGITRLRVRGMWIIKNPSSIFNEHIPKPTHKYNFQAFCVLREEKYQSLSISSRSSFESTLDSTLQMDKFKISDPNNPVSLIDARVISYVV